MLDGLALLRGAFIRLDDYRLETAAQHAPRTRQAHRPDAPRRARSRPPTATIRRALVAYNLEDARLVLEILARTGLVELAVRRSLLTGMQLDRVSAPIAVGRLALPGRAARARPRGAVGARGADGAARRSPAASCSTRGPGLYRNILVFDFKSLYPSLIRTFNIDPLTLRRRRRAPAPTSIRTPGGAAFRRDEPGILPALVARLGDERARARARGRRGRARRRSRS